MLLNVNREELIQALTEKRDEVVARLEKKIASRQVKLDEITPTATVEGWLRQVADLLRDGKVHVNRQQTMSVNRNSRERDRVYLVIHESARTSKGNDPAVPEFPVQNDQQVTTLKHDINHLKRQLARQVEPYDAAIRILNMSSDAQIGIQDGDYHGLLAGTPHRDHARGRDVDWDVGEDDDDEDEDDDDEDTDLRL